MSSYTQEQIKDLWDFFDEDKSGKIPCTELKNLFLKLGSDSETAAMKAEVSFRFSVSSFFQANKTLWKDVHSSKFWFPN